MARRTEYTLKWLFFGLSGRIRRMTYMLSAGFFVAVYTYLVLQIERSPEGSAQFGLWGLVFFAVLIVSAWSSVALTVKRLHDLGVTGFLALIMFVPMLSLLSFFILCAVSGTKGANQYGDSPIVPDK